MKKDIKFHDLFRQLHNEASRPGEDGNPVDQRAKDLLLEIVSVMEEEEEEVLDNYGNLRGDHYLVKKLE
jgi:hypothetical protein